METNQSKLNNLASPSEANQQYTTVHIQDLNPKARIEGEVVDCSSKWKKKLCTHNSKNKTPACKCSVMKYEETCSAQLRFKDNFFQTFYLAYQNDSDIILSPDDVWIYVKKNAQELQHLFVKGQKQVEEKKEPEQVQTQPSTQRSSEQSLQDQAPQSEQPKTQPKVIKEKTTLKTTSKPVAATQKVTHVQQKTENLKVNPPSAKQTQIQQKKETKQTNSKLSDNSKQSKTNKNPEIKKILLSVKVYCCECPGIWNQFFDKMIVEIANNTKNNVVENLQADFSTSGKIEKFMSTAVIMDTFQKYFTYKLIGAACGIRDVKFMGTVEDWRKLLTKLIQLKQYQNPNQQGECNWGKYVDGLVPIIEQFINTFQGKVDTVFWNKIMIMNRNPKYYEPETVSGWILQFYLKAFDKEKVELEDLVDKSFVVPVIYENWQTKIVKNVQICGGFGGVHIQDQALRPQMSFIVFHDGNQKPLI